MRVRVDSGLSPVLEIRVRCEITKEAEEETLCSVHSLIKYINRCLFSGQMHKEEGDEHNRR